MPRSSLHQSASYDEDDADTIQGQYEQGEFFLIHPYLKRV